MATAVPDRCPSCHAELPANAPGGHCPRCLLRDGIGSEALSLSRSGEVGATIDFGSALGVLETLGASVGPVPRVLLRDTDPASEPPVHRPASPEMPGQTDRQPRLRLLGEIARGGMGAVLKGRDEDLGRDLAVKILLERHKDDPDLIRRFIEEAQIGGQLQHPGIVPIYELGAFADRRPYFAMKLVKGQTLAALLAGRESPADGLPRFLGIFEQVAQTVAYAHARGVIHRDLKPSNVMVGSFGEVQVMDWGLAKVLPRGGAADDAAAGRVPDGETLISTARSGEDADLSRAGSVMGTPSYMAPEQARGEIVTIDERADVFALGSILCELLTGSPAFIGRSSTEIQRRAARGETAEALSRLDSSGAEAELLALSRDCLAVEPIDRPRDARVVSDRMTAYLGGVQNRLHASERERAVAEARAVEERRRRRLQFGLAASLLALTTLGGLAFTYEMNRRQTRAARADRLLTEATLLRNQARDHPEDVDLWHHAQEALSRVAEDIDPSAAAPLAELRREVAIGLKSAESDRALLVRLVDIRSSEASVTDTSLTDAAYAEAFEAAGIDPDGGDAAKAGAIVAGRPAPVAAALVGALDHWSAFRRTRAFVLGRDPKDPGWRRVLAVARAADPDPDRDALRAAMLVEDSAERLARLRPLSERADAGAWGPSGLVLLGEALANAGDSDAGVAVLRRASWSHPKDADVHYALGNVLANMLPPQLDEAIRAYSAAWALQPELAGNTLAGALARHNRGVEAEIVFRHLLSRWPENQYNQIGYSNYLYGQGRDSERTAFNRRVIASRREAIRLKPDDDSARRFLTFFLVATDDLRGAIAEYREAVRLKPDAGWAHLGLGDTLMKSGDLPGAIAAFREGLRLQPDATGGHRILGDALRMSGDLSGAIEAYREAIRLGPNNLRAHARLGNTLMKSGDLAGAIAEFREAVRLKLDDKVLHGEIVFYNAIIDLPTPGELPVAVEACREAIRLKPDDAVVHYMLGLLLTASCDFSGAIGAYREAIRLKPDLAEFYVNLGVALAASNDHAGAVAAYREAIRLKSDDIETHLKLGLALQIAGDHSGAIEAYREAIRLWPDYAIFYYELGGALRRQGHYAESLEIFRKGQTDRPDRRIPWAESIAEGERFVALTEQLPSVLAGTTEPKNNADRLFFAQMAYDAKCYAGAAELYDKALESDPKQAYNAACAAALAAAGKGEDNPKPDDAASAEFRRKALAWLKQELDAWSADLRSDNPKSQAEVARMLRHWKQDTDLVSVRDADSLKVLPEGEQAEWEALWSDVDRLLGLVPVIFP